MTRPNKTEILVLLDRSGSMESIRADTIGGFNTFLGDQKAQPGECSMTLVQFYRNGGGVRSVINQASPIQVMPPLTMATFQPGGDTPLLDAMGANIRDLGDRLQRLPDIERPSKVIFVVITDGAENASMHYTRNRVFEMVRHQQEKYGWEFVYLGANQDAIAVGADLGIGYGQTMTYAANSAGTNATYAAASAYVNNSRAGGQALNFSPQMRSAAVGKGVTSTVDAYAVPGSITTLPIDNTTGGKP